MLDDHSDIIITFRDQSFERQIRLVVISRQVNIRAMLETRSASRAFPPVSLYFVSHALASAGWSLLQRLLRRRTRARVSGHTLLFCSCNSFTPPLARPSAYAVLATIAFVDCHQQYEVSELGRPPVP